MSDLQRDEIEAETEVMRLFTRARQRLAAHDETEAYHLFQTAVTAAERSLPPDHPRLSSAYANLAMVEESPARAKKLLEAAIRIERKNAESLALDAAPDRIVTLLTNLAIIHQDLDDVDASQQCFEEAIERLERQPPTHSTRMELASLYFQLAMLLQENNHCERAAELLWSSIFLAGREQGVRCESVALYLYHMATLEKGANPASAFLCARVALYLFLKMEERTDQRFFETLARRVRDLERGEPCTEHTSLIASWIVENDPDAKDFFLGLCSAMQHPDPLPAQIAVLETFLTKLERNIASCDDDGQT
ncbi:MAG: tetratricopeptide repeat protein [Planctomycetia bacterium]|nr:tetratricopeptide repeat protein [Planctomycetia bacterium]